MIIFITSLLFWLFYVAVSPLITRLYAHAKRNNKWYYYPVVAILVIFGIVDIIYDRVIGTIVFWQWPVWSTAPVEMTFTYRLKWNIKYRWDWRHKLAVWVCYHLVEPWDFNHCGLNGVKEYARGKN